ncbi:MAG: hypothetical protein RLZZ385_1002 [Pseudomonadota bacterium]|jgi:outer membrane protein TolC
MRSYLTAYFFSMVLLPVGDALAQDQHPADHEPLQVSPNLDFAQLFAAALDNSPEARATVVRQATAEHFIAAGEAWIVDRPSWEASYIDDGLLDEAGLREMETGIQVNLWRPGERRSALDLGRSYGIRADTWSAHVNLLVAGRLRTALADLAEAEFLLQFEQQATQEAERLLQITRDLATAGAVAELDVMQAQSLLLEQRQILMRAEAALVDAERAYNVLTNLTVKPGAPHIETLSPLEELPLNHPYLAYMQSVIDVADGSIATEQRVAAGSPTVRFGVRRERGASLQPYIDSLGVSVSVPFGGKSATTARVSHAREVKVDREVEYAAAYRELTARRHEMEHELSVTESGLLLLEEQAQLGSRQWDMARTAFSAGEVTFLQVQLALQQANSANRNLELQRLYRQRLINEYNQTVGVLP